MPLECQIMDYVNHEYKERGYTNLYFSQSISGFYSEYNDYIFSFFMLCADILHDNDVTGIKEIVKQSKEELVKVINNQGNNFDLEKAKQFEVYIILEQYFQQLPNQFVLKSIGEYKMKVDVIMEYLSLPEF
jgi:hypothetical protein